MDGELFTGFIVCAVLIGLSWMLIPLAEKRGRDFGSRARLDGERAARQIHDAIQSH